MAVPLDKCEVRVVGAGLASGNVLSIQTQSATLHLSSHGAYVGTHLLFSGRSRVRRALDNVRECLDVRCGPLSSASREERDGRVSPG